MTTLSSASNSHTAGHPTSGYMDDAYSEGFVDGRASMAETVAKQLLGEMNDEAISRLTGLSVDTLQTLRTTSEGDASHLVPRPAAETTPDEDSRFRLIRETPTHDTAFVEPNFVRLIREVNQLTQAELAKQLDVHERTVSVWETADTPVRLRTATYDKLITLSKTQVPHDLHYHTDAEARIPPA